MFLLAFYLPTEHVAVSGLIFSDYTELKTTSVTQVRLLQKKPVSIFSPLLILLTFVASNVKMCDSFSSAVAFPQPAVCRHHAHHGPGTASTQSE